MDDPDWPGYLGAKSQLDKFSASLKAYGKRLFAAKVNYYKPEHWGYLRKYIVQMLLVINSSESSSHLFDAHKALKNADVLYKKLMEKYMKTYATTPTKKINRYIKLADKHVTRATYAILKNYKKIVNDKDTYSETVRKDILVRYKKLLTVHKERPTYKGYTVRHLWQTMDKFADKRK